MTVVLADTGEVEIVNEAVKPLSGAMVVGGTLATPGLLLDKLITAPPNGAPVLSTTVPNDGSPPTTVEGFASSDPKPGGGGACCGVKLRTAENGPATPSVLTPRTRQK